MGNDGGSIPTRRELVKEAARNPTATELKETQKEYLAHRWSICPVSHKPLIKPVVSDYTGDLYNKDAVIQFLLPAEATSIDRAEYDKFIQGRIKLLKDVVEVHFETELDEVTKAEKRICPVTSKELGPKVKAVYLVPCGHAFSQEAIREMKGDHCIQCGQAYEDQNIIPVLPSTEADKAFVIKRIENLRSQGLSHSLKKAHGGKKRKANGVEKSHQATEDEKTTGVSKPKETKLTDESIPRAENSRFGTSTPKQSSAIKNAATAGLTARVLEEQESRKKQRLENENIGSLYTKKNDGKSQPDGNFMTRGFSIAQNARY